MLRVFAYSAKNPLHRINMQCKGRMNAVPPCLQKSHNRLLLRSAFRLRKQHATEPYEKPSATHFPITQDMRTLLKPLRGRFPHTPCQALSARLRGAILFRHFLVLRSPSTNFLMDSCILCQFFRIVKSFFWQLFTPCIQPDNAPQFSDTENSFPHDH